MRFKPRQSILQDNSTNNEHLIPQKSISWAKSDWTYQWCGNYLVNREFRAVGNLSMSDRCCWTQKFLQTACFIEFKFNFRKVLIHWHSCFPLWPDADSILETVAFRFSLMEINKWLLGKGGGGVEKWLGWVTDNLVHQGAASPHPTLSSLKASQWWPVALSWLTQNSVVCPAVAKWRFDICIARKCWKLGLQHCPVLFYSN